MLYLVQSKSYRFRSITRITKQYSVHYLECTDWSEWHRPFSTVLYRSSIYRVYLWNWLSTRSLFPYYTYLRNDQGLAGQHEEPRDGKRYHGRHLHRHTHRHHTHHLLHLASTWNVRWCDVRYGWQSVLESIVIHLNNIQGTEASSSNLDKRLVDYAATSATRRRKNHLEKMHNIIIILFFLLLFFPDLFYR